MRPKQVIYKQGRYEYLPKMVSVFVNGLVYMAGIQLDYPWFRNQNNSGILKYFILWQ